LIKLQLLFNVHDEITLQVHKFSNVID